MKVFSWSLTTVSPFVKLNVPFNKSCICYTGVFHLLHHLFHLFCSSVGLDNIDFLDTNAVAKCSKSVGRCGVWIVWATAVPKHYNPTIEPS